MDPIQITPTPQPMTPELGIDGPQTGTVPSSRKAVLVGIGISLVIIASGIGAAAYLGWIPFLAKRPPTLDEVADAWSKVASARVRANIMAKVEPREADVEAVAFFSAQAPTNPETGSTTSTTELSPMSMSGLGTSALLRGIPSTLDASVAVTSLWRKSDDAKDADADTQVKGIWKTDGLTANFDVSLRRAAGMMYGRIGTLPIPFIDVAPISGKWIAFPKSTSGAADIFNASDPATQVFGKAPETPGMASATAAPEVSFAADARALFVEALQTRGLSVVGTDAKAEVDGRKAWRMTLAFNPDDYRNAVDILCVQAHRDEAAGTEHALLTENFCKPPSAEDQDRFRKLTRNLSIQAWIDKQTSAPIRLIIDLKAAPDASVEKLADKQLHVGVDVSLSDVNELVAVETPTSTISLKEATRFISGKTQAEAQFDDQMAVITDLRSALKSYQKSKGSFPGALADLLGTERNASSVVVNVPNDQYTSQPFVFTSTGTDYALTYVMHLPPTEGATFSSLSQSGKYVEGTNTADSFAVSREAMSAKDSDKDGLNDYEEAVHGTNRLNPDTDGDGFSDQTEIDGGFDPLKNAKTGRVITRFQS